MWGGEEWRETYPIQLEPGMPACCHDPHGFCSLIGVFRHAIMSNWPHLKDSRWDWKSKTKTVVAKQNRLERPTYPQILEMEFWHPFQKGLAWSGCTERKGALQTPWDRRRNGGASQPLHFPPTLEEPAALHRLIIGPTPGFSARWAVTTHPSTPFLPLCLYRGKRNKQTQVWEAGRGGGLTTTLKSISQAPQRS